MADVLGVIPSVGEQLDSSLWYVINASRNIAANDYNNIMDKTSIKTYTIGSFKAVAITSQSLHIFNYAMYLRNPLILIPNMAEFSPTLHYEYSGPSTFISNNYFSILSSSDSITIKATCKQSSAYYASYSFIISVFE